MNLKPAQRNEDLARLNQATVLVVDTDPVTTSLVRSALQAAGISQVIASGEPATLGTLLASTQADLLLLGAGAANTSGFALLDMLRADERWRDLPVILMLDAEPASGLGPLRLKALERNATDILDKPVDASELTLRLRNALGHKLAQDRLLKHDPLTGLANRGEFMRRLSAVLDGGDPTRSVTRSLLLLNLDRFKQVNDTLGHLVGDELLQAVALRLSSVIARYAGGDRRGVDPSATPWLARIEGDRFMALLPGGLGDAAHDACIVALMAALAQPHHLHGREIVISASIGLATAPADGHQAEQLVKRAELAAAMAKRHGGHRVEYFSPDFETRAAERLMLEHHLRYAIRHGELRLYYQPKVDCASLRMVGVEALVRWQHPQLGLVPPDRFIPIAEATGMIVEIGAWVLNEACRQGRAWLDEGLPPLQIAVNLSAGQTGRGDIVATVAQTLARSGFPASQLTLELTESLLMAPGERSAALITQLKGLGLSLSLDDFGTGYSSMTYLRRFPIDEIKIDRSFVHGLPHQRDSVAITRAIVALASGLDLQVVAEGVELPQELEFLQQFERCLFQGYLFSKPLPGDGLTALLRSMAPAQPPGSMPASASASRARSDSSL